MPIKQTPQIPPHERAQNAYKQLSITAATLNSASDKLSEAISLFDAALKKLNLGISAWVTVSGNDEDGEWWARSIGYAKPGDKWGISLKNAAGNYNYPDRDSVEQWLFNDAPRWMRIEAASKIPDLLEALHKQAEEAANKIAKRTDEVLMMAAAMAAVADQNQPAGQK